MLELRLISFRHAIFAERVVSICRPFLMRRYAMPLPERYFLRWLYDAPDYLRAILCATIIDYFMLRRYAMPCRAAISFHLTTTF